MATATLPTLIGPSDHGRRMSLAAFIRADFEEGWLYELARGVVEVTEVPGPSHGMIVMRLVRLFVQYELRHPGVIDLQAGPVNVGFARRAFSPTVIPTRRFI
jgi:hypothetical protein